MTKNQSIMKNNQYINQKNKDLFNASITEAEREEIRLAQLMSIIQLQGEAENAVLDFDEYVAYKLQEKTKQLY